MKVNGKPYGKDDILIDESNRLELIEEVVEMIQPVLTKYGFKEDRNDEGRLNGVWSIDFEDIGLMYEKNLDTELNDFLEEMFNEEDVCGKYSSYEGQKTKELITQII